MREAGPEDEIKKSKGDLGFADHDPLLDEADLSHQGTQLAILKAAIATLPPAARKQILDEYLAGALESKVVSPPAAVEHTKRNKRAAAEDTEALEQHHRFEQATAVLRESYKGRGVMQPPETALHPFPIPPGGLRPHVETMGGAKLEEIKEDDEEMKAP